MSGNVRNLNRRQVRAIQTLLTCRTQAEAATAAAISVRQLERWLADPTFRAAIAAASRERLNATIGRLRAAAGEAVDTLRAALADDRMANRIRAASVLLETAVKIEVDDLAARVAALEAAQAGSKP